MTNVLDSQDLLGVAAAMPEQVQQAARASRNLERLPDKERVENIVVIGVGGSGIAGDVLVAAAAPFVPVPITVVKGYELPAFVGEGSLVFAISYSGNTEETLEAATDAAVQGSSVVVISGGGELTQLGASWGSPIVRVPKSIPQARAAIGALAIPPIAILEDIGLFPGATQWIDFTIEQLKVRRDELEKPNSIAERLAARLTGKLAVVTGGGAIGATAAQRWKTQINNNAKSMAYASSQPELSHNEAGSWEALAEWTRQKVGIVALRHDDEHPQVGRRFDLVHEHVTPNVAFVENVVAQGEGDLAQLFDLMMVGDYTSLHMARIQGVDPGPLPYIDSLKASLSER